MKTGINLIIVSFLFLVTISSGQEKEKLLLNERVTTGVLSNGFTYYLLPNDVPEHKIEFRLVVKAGQAYEDNKQTGLAHFVEHMAFNGTKNYPKNELISFLEGAGIQFGNDINAYTAFNETVYELPVPSTPKMIDQALQVLEDWAHQIVFDPTQIDAERGVIKQELLRRDTDDSRLYTEINEVLYPNSIYGQNRDDLEQDNINTFDHKDLIRFYHDWYRPDNMAIIAVGNFNVTEMEQKIKQKFRSIPVKTSPVHTLKLKSNNLNENKLLLIEKDNLTFNIVEKYFLIPNQPTITQDQWLYNFGISVILEMLTDRFERLQKSPDCPYSIAEFSHYSAPDTSKRVINLVLAYNYGQVQNALSVLSEEIERIKRFGFLQSEIEKTKNQTLNRIQNQIKEESKKESKDYIDALVDHFIKGNQVISTSQKLKMAELFFKDLKPKTLNQIVSHIFSVNSQATIVTGKSNTLPNKNRVQKIEADTYKKKLQQVKETKTIDKLLSTLPQPGSIVEEKIMGDTGVIQWVLSNGASVLIKPTNFKNNEILFGATSIGGNISAHNYSLASVSLSSLLLDVTGFGNYSSEQLEEFMEEKEFSAEFSINSFHEEVSGATTPKSLPDFMQFIHLGFTKKRKDKNAFKAMANQQSSLYSGLLQDPDNYFVNAMSHQSYNFAPFLEAFPTKEDFENADHDTLLNLFNDKFGNAGDFIFYFVGNVEPKTLKPLVEQYIANLPTTKEREKFTHTDLGFAPGVSQKIIYFGNAKQSKVAINYHNSFDNTPKEAFLLKKLGELIEIKVTEVLREKESKSYSPGAYFTIDNEPLNRAFLTIDFSCETAYVDRLIELSHQIITDIKAGKITNQDAIKIREIYLKNKEDDLRNNEKWFKKIKNWALHKGDIQEKLLQEKYADQITKENLIRVAKKYLDAKKVATLIMHPILNK